MMKYTILFLMFLFMGACNNDTNVTTVKAVQDNAEIMSAMERRNLTQKLVEIEKYKAIQIVILTVPYIPNSGTIEAYANEYFNSKGIGKKGQDRGLLILMSMKSKKIRLEVGRGNEGWMPDHKTAEYTQLAIDDFKKSLYYQGLMKIINGIEKDVGE